MTTLPFSITSLLFFVSLLPAFAQPVNNDWVLQKNEDGIQIFSRLVGSNPLAETKGITAVLGNIDSAFKILQDPVLCASSDPFLRSTKILKKVDSTETYYYQVTKMPVILKDRDGVIRQKSAKTANGYIITLEPASNLVPEVDGMVRLSGFKVLISLQVLTPSTFELMYRISLEEAGMDIPVGVVNKATITSTFERLTLLRALVAPSLKGISKK